MPQIILIMGTSGSGKSTVGSALAAELGWEFIEADQHHPKGNIEKLAAGIPLSDEDRQPWLAALRDEIDARLDAVQNAVLACSALREAYRRQLRAGRESQIPIIYLRGDAATLKARLKSRRGHYMGPEMLASQLETLEDPADALVIPLDRPIPEAVATIRKHLGV